ncbi:unnamed protein product, partial [Ectocarpus sp. 8 AP-2014]
RSNDGCARDGDLAREEGRGNMGGSSRRRRRGSSARTLAAGLALTLAACSTPAYGSKTYRALERAAQTLSTLEQRHQLRRRFF